VTSGASLTKSFTPNTIAAGGVSQIRVNLNNALATPLTGGALTDNLPAGVTVAAAPTPTNTCVGGVVTAIPGATSIAISGATIPADGTCNFRVRVTSSTPGVVTNTIPVGALTTNEGVTNVTTATANLTVTAGGSIVKAFAPATISLGGQSTLTITISNSQPFPLTSASLTDTLPVGAQLVTVANPANASTTCSGGTVTAAPGSGSVSLSGASIPAASGVTPGTCTVSVDVTSSTATTSVNTIPAGALTDAEGVTNVTAASANLVKRALTVALNKSFTPVSIPGGGTSVLSVTLSNSTAVALTGVGLTDNLPAGMTVASVPGASTTCAGGTVSAVPSGASFSLSGAGIAGGGNCSISVNVTSFQQGNLTNTLPIGAISSTQGATNPSAASATLTVLAGSGIGKSFSPVAIAPGGVSTLTITIYNSNVFALTNASLTDTLPAGVAIAPTPNASPRFPAGGAMGSAFCSARWQARAASIGSMSGRRPTATATRSAADELTPVDGGTSEVTVTACDFTPSSSPIART